MDTAAAVSDTEADGGDYQVPNGLAGKERPSGQTT
jgi:hypothetical protein